MKLNTLTGPVSLSDGPYTILVTGNEGKIWVNGTWIVFQQNSPPIGQDSDQVFKVSGA